MVIGCQRPPHERRELFNLGGTEMNKFGMVAVSSAIAAVVTGIGAVDATSARPNESTSARCIEMGPSGRQVWHGPAKNATASALGDVLDAIADANKDVV